MVWSQGSVNDILGRLTQKTKPLVVPGSEYPLAQSPVALGGPSIQQRSQDQLQNSYDRLGVIDDISNDRFSTGQTDYLTKAEDMMYRANQINQQAAMLRLQNAGRTFQGNNGGGHSSKQQKIPKVSGNGQLAAFLRAIAHKESGGNYGAVNHSSGAMGKYQIMPGNIAGPGGWDKEILGKNISTSQFLHSPKLQERIAQGKLTQYYRKYGAAGAASAWYSGSPTKWKTSKGSQGAYPSINGYVMDILRAIGAR